MSKSRLRSKYMQTRYDGHSRPKCGHRRVSGLVRASLRNETQKLILEQLQEEET